MITMPEPTAWNDPATPPAPYWPVRILLPDHSMTTAHWTGKVWWGQGREQTPEGWAPFASEFGGLTLHSDTGGEVR